MAGYTSKQKAVMGEGDYVGRDGQKRPIVRIGGKLFVVERDGSKTENKEIRL